MILRVLTALLLLALMGCAAKPSIEPGLSEAEEAVRRAEKAGAERYSHGELIRAKSLMEMASRASDLAERSEPAAMAKLYLSTLERLAFERRMRSYPSSPASKGSSCLKPPEEFS